jgi:cell division protein FtsB
MFKGNSAMKDTDWHDLAKKLQAALEAQVDENEQLEEEIEDLNNKILDQLAVIEYLEKRNGNNSI